MKKNGFTFIETIITVVVLSATLMLLYSAYSKIISNEESKVYYNDTAYLYRTNYVLKFIKENASIEEMVEDIKNTSYAITFGNKYFSDDSVIVDFNSIREGFNIHQIYIASTDLFECTDTMNNESDSKCNIGLSTPWLRSYIKTLSPEKTSNKQDEDDYYLIIEYSEEHGKDSSLSSCDRIMGTNTSDKCKTYYSSLRIYVADEIPKYVYPAVSLSATKTHNSITLTANGVNGTNPIVSYRFKKGSEAYTNSTSANTSSYGNLTPNTTYSFTVEVTDSGGYTATNTLSVTTDAYINPRITGVEKSVQFDGATITVNANAGTSAIAAYEYKLSSDSNYTSNGSSNIISISNLASNTNYTYYVRIKDINNNYSNALKVEFKTPTLDALHILYSNPNYTKCQDLKCALDELLELTS